VHLLSEGGREEKRGKTGKKIVCVVRLPEACFSWCLSQQQLCLESNSSSSGNASGHFLYTKPWGPIPSLHFCRRKEKKKKRRIIKNKEERYVKDRTGSGGEGG